MVAVPSDYDQLLKRIERCLDSLSNWEGTVYRSVTPNYATSGDLLLGIGSAQMGGRWNPVGIATVYASETPELAMAETLAHYRYYRIPVEKAMPRFFVAVQATFSRLLDLTSATVRRRIGVSEETLRVCDWRTEMVLAREPITQRIGRASFESGFEGLIAPSSTGFGGRNLVWFPLNLSKGAPITANYSKFAGSSS